MTQNTNSSKAFKKDIKIGYSLVTLNSYQTSFRRSITLRVNSPNTTVKPNSLQSRKKILKRSILLSATFSKSKEIISKLTSGLNKEDPKVILTWIWACIWTNWFLIFLSKTVTVISSLFSTRVSVTLITITIRELLNSSKKWRAPTIFGKLLASKMENRHLEMSK